ncbi:hypothetical protein SAMN04515618_10870 [Collimonas sp. OK307]|uniref:hypothetical protein n=1 Tax=Collimonas sp. OK307 TaxID=1801620 RepID=UPI0008E2F8DE|nr:hypothetical protein [Collimonas sp. OK307]SFI02733.1 hypothetical protein SAMN04515618_10870 [Collimonas sp. OK307]
MKILDHEPQQWFLVQDGDAVLLDVACSHSAFQYDFQLELNEAEKAAYAEGGHTYLNRLTYSIHYSAPGVIGNSSPYKSRKLEAVKVAQMQISILSWVRENGTKEG